MCCHPLQGGVAIVDCGREWIFRSLSPVQPYDDRIEIQRELLVLLVPLVEAAKCERTAIDPEKPWSKSNTTAAPGCQARRRRRVHPHTDVGRASSPRNPVLTNGDSNRLPGRTLRR